LTPVLPGLTSAIAVGDIPFGQIFNPDEKQMGSTPNGNIGSMIRSDWCGRNTSRMVATAVAA
jgi:hypothetical protein